MSLIFVIAFLILEILATLPIPSKLNLMAAGLACYAASLLFGAL